MTGVVNDELPLRTSVQTGPTAMPQGSTLETSASGTKRTGSRPDSISRSYESPQPIGFNHPGS